MEALKSNIQFVLVCLLVFAALFVVAELLERVLIHTDRKAKGARYIAFVAMFSAISGVLMLAEIPLFFAPSFYKMDLSELPVLLCSFYLGPVAGVTTELLKVIIKLLLKGTSTAFVGDFANFFVGSMFIIPASAIYHFKKSRKSAIVGMVIGTIIMAVVGSAFNAFFLIPKFAELFHMPIDVIVAMGTKVNPAISSVSTLVLFAVVPFNILKGAIDSVLSCLLYKRLGALLFKK